MKYKIKYLPAAIEDLKQIQDWHTLEFSNKSSLKVLNNILDNIEKLSNFPDTGSYPPDEVLEALGFRILIIKKHIAIYKIIAKEIYIYHIADAKTDYGKLF